MVVLAVLSAFIVVLAAGDDLICTPSKEQAAPICIERLVLRLRAVNGTVVDLSPAAHRLKTEGKDGAAATSTLQDFSESDGRHHQQPGFLISTTTVRSDYLVVEPANVGTDAVGGGSVAGVFEHATCRGSSAQDEYTYMGNGQCADARGIVPNYAWKNHAFDGGTLKGCFALCKRLRGCIGFHLIFARNTCGVYSPAFGPGVGANGWPGYSEMSESPSATEIASTYTGQSSEYMCYKLTGPASWSVSTWIKLDKYAWADKAPQVVHDSLVILSDRKTEPRYLSIENGYMGYALGGDNNQHQDKHATTQRIPLKTWTHLEWSVADGTIRTYVNGVQTDLMQGPGVRWGPPDSKLHIFGSPRYDPGRYWPSALWNEMRLEAGPLRRYTEYTPTSASFDQSFSRGGGCVLQFDGVDDYLKLDGTVAEQMIPESAMESGWTIEAWIRFDNAGKAEGHGSAVFFTTCGFNNVYIKDGVLQYLRWPSITDQTTTSLVDGHFHHIAAVSANGGQECKEIEGSWDSCKTGPNSVRLFVDGVAEAAISLGDMHGEMLDNWFYFGCAAGRCCGCTHKGSDTPTLNNFAAVTLHSMRASTGVRYTEDFAPPPAFVDDATTTVLFHVNEGSGNKLHHEGNPAAMNATIEGATWSCQQAPWPSTATTTTTTSTSATTTSTFTTSATTKTTATASTETAGAPIEAADATNQSNHSFPQGSKKKKVAGGGIAASILIPIGAIAAATWYCCRGSRSKEHVHVRRDFLEREASRNTIAMETNPLSAGGGAGAIAAPPNDVYYSEIADNINELDADGYVVDSASSPAAIVYATYASSPA